MSLCRLAMALVVTFPLLACGSRGELLDGEAGAGGSGGAGGASASQGTGASGATDTSSGSGSGVGGTTSAQSGSAVATTGSGPTSGSVTSSATGGRVCPGFGDVCTECMSESCADRYCNCYENQTCLDLFQCTNACGNDEACKQGCLATHEEGISDALGLSDCAATTCTDECGWGDDLSPCTDCLLTGCEESMNACLAEPECLTLFNCITGCPSFDLACQQACYDDHGGGVPTLQSLLMCSQSACDDVCN